MNQPVSVPKFPQATSLSLHSDLRKRVQQYFDEQQISAAGTPALFTKAINVGISVVYHVMLHIPHKMIGTQ